MEAKEEVIFEGGIEVVNEGDMVVLVMGSDGIELSLEEAAVLCYQLQLSLKQAAGQKIQQAVEQTI